MAPRAGVDRADVNARLVLECKAHEARSRAILDRDGGGKPCPGALPPASEHADKAWPMLDRLSDDCAQAWASWSIAQAKLSLFASEMALGSRSNTEHAAEIVDAIHRVRALTTPPLLHEHPERLQGHWSLVRPSCEASFGVRSIDEISGDVHRYHGGIAFPVEVQAIVRCFVGRNRYSETCFFDDLTAGDPGSFTESGRFDVMGVNGVCLQPRDYLLKTGAGETLVEHMPGLPRVFNVNYLDGDLFFEGTHDDASAQIRAWGRDHSVPDRF